MKHLIRFFIFIFITVIVSSYSHNTKDKINWITLQELNEQYAKTPKPILIDIYTTWCGWCKEMDRTTYKHDKLSTYINEHFYAIKFDAESKAPITFNNKIYKYNKQYKTHDLAIYLTNGQLSYPTTVFIGGANTQPAPLPGYMKPKEMEAPLKFFGEKADAIETFVNFNKKLKAEW
jgi:thioredoxin-related protein